MSDAGALDNARTGTPDNSLGIQIPTIVTQESASFEAPCGVSLSDAIPNTPSAHRANVTVDTAVVDMTSAGFGSSGLQNINNRGALLVWAVFATAGASCTLRPIWYDAATTPAPMATGPVLAFTASAKTLAGSGNMYMSEAQIVDAMGFKKFKIYCESISAGDVDIFAVPI